MGGRARQAIDAREVVVLADRGYYNGDEVLACEGTGILPATDGAMTKHAVSARDREHAVRMVLNHQGKHGSQ